MSISTLPRGLERREAVNRVELSETGSPDENLGPTSEAKDQLSVTSSASIHSDSDSLSPTFSSSYSDDIGPQGEGNLGAVCSYCSINEKCDFDDDAVEN